MQIILGDIVLQSVICQDHEKAGTQNRKILYQLYNTDNFGGCLIVQEKLIASLSMNDVLLMIKKQKGHKNEHMTIKRN